VDGLSIDHGTGCPVDIGCNCANIWIHSVSHKSTFAGNKYLFLFIYFICQTLHSKLLLATGGTEMIAVAAMQLWTAYKLHIQKKFQVNKIK
jgi:hypothetical protein